MDFPTLPAYRTKLGGQLAVWCEHERTWHRHGAVSAEKGAGDGHRSAHCMCPNSPHQTLGYALNEVGRFTKAVETSHGRRARFGRCPSCP